MNSARGVIVISLLPAVFTLLSSRLRAQESLPPGWTVRVPVRSTLDSLMRDEDTDNDTKITIDDPHVPGTQRGDRRFWFAAPGGRPYEVEGTYYLANLLGELKRAEDEGRDTIALAADRIFEPPAERTSRLIREDYWDALTRTVDRKGLLRMFTDEKIATGDGRRYVYVPASDSAAWDYFSAFARERPDLRVIVARVPARVTAAVMRGIDGHHGVLTLALRRAPGGGVEGVPFVVPGGRFNEMYGWDSYFITLGLLSDGRTALARDMVDNFVYEVNHYGKILNANRTYYLTRSQPPFLTSMIRAVWDHLPRNDTTRAWLRGALTAAISEYTGVWMNADHLTRTGLSRYFDTGKGPPPEVEPGAYDAIYAPFAQKAGMDVRSFERAYREGRVSSPDLDAFFVHDRAMRESGHDTSYRLLGKCADLVTVDLNSLLYRIERDIGELIRDEFHGAFSGKGGVTYSDAEWFARAEHRKALVDRYLWDAEAGMYFDYNVASGRRERYVSATTLYPLWAGLAGKAQGATLVSRALPLLEAPGGIVGSDEASRGTITPERPERQWDYPNGWAPHQIIAWQGLLNYGRREDAVRLAYRWLYTITSNAVNYSGTVTEKYDLEHRTHMVFAEYGNVGAEFSYITREGFGWTNASYQEGLARIGHSLQEDLDRLIPPEWVFPGM